MSGEPIPTMVHGAELAVATCDIAKRFGKANALKRLSLTVPAGAFYLLVGPNGAGKSTTMRVIMDIVRADAGVAEVFGLDTSNSGAIVRAQIGWVPEKHETHYGWMRVGRLLKSHAQYYPSWDAQYATQLAYALDIKVERKFGSLSKGEQRRVQILMALAHRPHLLLLDEPTDGLDPAARESVLGLLAEHMAETGCTVLVSTHLVSEMDRLADHLGVMRDGALVAQIRREELDTRMRNYLLEVPTDWNGAEQNGITLVRGNGRQHELRWMIWGEQEEVVSRLNALGATVRDVEEVSLQDAAVALLTRAR